MALITTPKAANADSYVTLSEYAAYVLAAHNVVLDEDADAEANLRRAAQVIDRKYQFRGYKTDQNQALQFPRVTDVIVDGRAVDSDVVPTQIKSAQCELAYLIKGGLDPFETVSIGSIKRSRSKAGPVETEKEYSGGRETPRIVAIEGLLRPFKGGAGAGRIRLGRA